MNQEELVRQIMAEVMENMGVDNQVSFNKSSEKKSEGKKPAASQSSAKSTHHHKPGDVVTHEDYPLGANMPDEIRSASGKLLSEFTFEKVINGDLDATDFRISPETLEMQAQVAESLGRDGFAANMRRASELIIVPDDRLLEIYNAIRPYRSTKEELLEIAHELETEYNATVNAEWIREAADVYEKRDRLRRD